jgi:hypothetical protein
LSHSGAIRQCLSREIGSLLRAVRIASGIATGNRCLPSDLNPRVLLRGQ